MMDKSTVWGFMAVSALTFTPRGRNCLEFYVRSGAGAMMSYEHFYTPGHQETGSIAADDP